MERSFFLRPINVAMSSNNVDTRPKYMTTRTLSLANWFYLSPISRFKPDKSSKYQETPGNGILWNNIITEKILLI